MDPVPWLLLQQLTSTAAVGIGLLWSFFYHPPQGCACRSGPCTHPQCWKEGTVFRASLLPDAELLYVLVELHEVSIRTVLQAVQDFMDSSCGYQHPTPPAAESALPHLLQIVDRGNKQGMSPDGPLQYLIGYQPPGTAR